MGETDADMQGCELCASVHPIEDMTRGEFWICPSCQASWDAHFKSCDHKWSPTEDEHGDDAHICERCNGLVRDEDFLDATGKPAPERPSEGGR